MIDALAWIYYAHFDALVIKFTAKPLLRVLN